MKILRLKIFHTTVLAILVFLIILCMSLAAAQLWLHSLFTLPCLLLFTLVFQLSRSGYHLLARGLFMITALLSITVGTALLGRASQIGLFYISAAILPFPLFVQRERVIGSLFSLSAFLLFVIFYWLIDFPALQPLPLNFAKNLALFHCMGSFLAAVAPSMLLHRDLDYAYQKIIKQTEQTAQAEHSAALVRLAADTAHEIKNPLAIVDVVLQISKTHSILQQEPNLLAKFDQAKVAIHRINDTIHKMQSFAYSPMRRFEFLPISELPKLIRKIFEERRGVFEIGFSIHWQGPIVGSLYCQVLSIQDIMHNLLQNAIDAVKHSKQPNIRIILDSSKEQLEILVADNGKGISAQDQDRIFDPFFTTKEIGRGAGLGLTSSRSLARHHAGDLVHVPGPGGRFLVSFPISQHLAQDNTELSLDLSELSVDPAKYAHPRFTDNPRPNAHSWPIKNWSELSSPSQSINYCQEPI
ncbi:MAG: HAMP domain-containing sensor histidine kinase [Proteobacteria bacterium]|nr:HAMP domain-containing sensor histidine kinase [Pseudomonadota bacterium]